MYKLEAKYKVVTPLFAGAAEPENKAELRAPSFKGVLRFWYRAMALSFYKDWKKVRDAEQRLFGSTDGQAAFRLKIEPEQKPETVPKGERWNNQGSAYLGYGVIGWIGKKKQVETTRPFLKEGFSFNVTLVMPEKRQKEVDTEGLKRALKALGLFGGLGSRSRKGFGSVNMLSLLENGHEVWTVPFDTAGLSQEMQALFEGAEFYDSEPEYTAFSRQSRISLWPSNSEPSAVLDEVGKEMVRYRSYGQSRGEKRVVLGSESAEQNFPDDHDMVWDAVQGEEPYSHPRRVAFGLPHNYFFFSTKQKVDVNGKDSQRRRASPLFIHIHQLNNQCAAIFTLLPARFLPVDESIKIAVAKGKEYFVKPQVDYNVLHDFINRFSNSLEVLP